jgi:hypothetical protein
LGRDVEKEAGKVGVSMIGYEPRTRVGCMSESEQATRFAYARKEVVL